MSTNGGGSIYPGGGGTGDDPQGTGSDTDGETAEQPDDDDVTTQQQDSDGGAIYPGGGGTGDDPQGTGSDTDDGTDTGGDGGGQIYPGGGGTGDDPQGTGSDTDGETDTGDGDTGTGGDQVYPGGGGTGDDPQGTGSDTDTGGDQVYPGGGGTGDDPQGTGSDTTIGDRIYPGGGGTQADPQSFPDATDDRIYPGGAGTTDDAQSYPDENILYPGGGGAGTRPQSYRPDPEQGDPVNIVDPGPQDITQSQFQAIQQQSEYDVDPSDVRLLDDGGWRYSESFLQEQGLQYDAGVPSGEPVNVFDWETGDITQSDFEQMQEQTDADIDPSDLRLVDGEITLSRAFRREQAAEETGFDASDIFITEGGGIGLLPSGEEQRESEIAEQLESQAEQIAGRDVDPGEDFTITEQGGEYGVRWTDLFLEEQAERDVEAETGLEAGEDFTVDVSPGNPFGSGGQTPEGDSRDVDVEWTDQFVQEQIETTTADPVVELTDEQRAARDQGLQDGIIGSLEDIAQPIIGPPGNIEQDVGYAVSDPVGAITGPPGTLEQEAGSAYFGSLGIVASGGTADPMDLVGGAPGSIESGVGDVAYDIRDASAASVDTVAPPASDILGDVVEYGSRMQVATDPQANIYAPESAEAAQEGAPQSALDTFRPPEQEVTETTVGERLGEGIARGGVEATIGFPAGAVDAGGLVADATEFTVGEVEEEGVVEGGISSAAAGGEFAYEAGETIVQQAVQNPAYFAGVIGGGIAGGAAATPLRISRVDIPTRDGGTTAVRGARIREPAIVRPLTGRQRGRTLAGTRGYRPTLGAPSLRDVDVDYAGLGTTGTATAEAMSSFEADIFRSTAADIGGESRQQFSAAEAVQQQAARQSGAEFQFDTPEEAIGQARAVPEESVGDVTQALRDLDATVFGSVAARARVEGFRQPRDIDITVPDEAAAQTRLAEALEGEQATVSDVFDIKTESDAPGRAFGGEEIKSGFESMEPETLGGVRFNPAEEELIRKAGASAFIRGPGAAGTPDLDVGPEPRRPGRADVREKDVQDTAEIGRELLGEGGVSEFESAFGIASEGADTGTGGLFATGREAAGDLTVPDGLQAFRQDTRAQVGAGLGATRVEADGGQQTAVTQQTEVDTTEAAPSPAASPGGAGTPVTSGVFETPDSPTGRTDAQTPSPSARTPDGSSIFGASPTTSPGQVGDTETFAFGGSPVGETDESTQQVPSPFGGAGGEAEPTTTPSPVGQPSPGGVPGPGGIPSPTPSPPSEGLPGFGIPTQPYATPGGGDEPTSRIVRMERGDERDDELEYQPETPTGEEFVNPVATGQQFLFGGSLSGGEDNNGGNPFEMGGGDSGNENNPFML